MSKFDELLNELELAGKAPMQKSMASRDGEGAAGIDSDDDENINAAAKDGAAQGAEDDWPDGEGESESEDDKKKKKKKKKGEVDGDGADEDEDENEDEEVFGKSFTLRDEDGHEFPALDATKVIKQLMTRVERSEKNLLKSLTISTAAVTSLGLRLSKRDSLIKALRTDLDALRNTGRGRKSVVSITEKGSEGTADEGIPASEFMAKAMVANAAGRIGGSEIARIEAYANRGLAPPDELVRKVLEGAA